MLGESDSKKKNQLNCQYIITPYTQWTACLTRIVYNITHYTINLNVLCLNYHLHNRTLELQYNITST